MKNENFCYKEDHGSWFLVSCKFPGQIFQEYLRCSVHSIDIISSFYLIGIYVYYTNKYIQWFFSLLYQKKIILITFQRATFYFFNNCLNKNFFLLRCIVSTGKGGGKSSNGSLIKQSKSMEEGFVDSRKKDFPVQELPQR